MPAGDRDSEAGDVPLELGDGGLGRTGVADGIGRVRPLERVEREGEVADRARKGPTWSRLPGKRTTLARDTRP